MGNDNSTGQGVYMTHGSRDVGKVAKVSNWPELAGATQKESNELGRNPHRCYGHMTEV